MKKSIFYITILFIFFSLLISCTTDSYDKDMENSSVIQSDYTTVATDPIIIPKKD
ncbi:MAG: hypothetical protein HC854_18140 [Flavobacterium sp.]|nr:hypothetical protein [Flavobacterium sp.]